MLQTLTGSVAGIATAAAARARAQAVALGQAAWCGALGVAGRLWTRLRALAAAHGPRGTTRVLDWLEHACTIVGPGFADRVVERALKIQIGFLVFLAAIAPFGAMEKTAMMAPLLLAQAGLTRLALMRVRRRDPVFGAGLYMVIAAVTFIEAKGYSGFVGAIFALEAMLSLIAAFYIVALLRVRGGEPREGEAAGA